MSAKKLPTRAELTAPIDATCGKCGGPARIYSYPAPGGTCVCLAGCSPAWLDSFLAFASKGSA